METITLEVMQGPKSSEHRAKISATLKRRFEEPDFRTHMADAQHRAGLAKRGRSVPDDVRAKISATVKKLWLDPEYRRRMQVSLPLRKHRPPLTEEERRAASERLKARQLKMAETAAGRMKLLQNITLHYTPNQNRSEQKLEAILEQLEPATWKYVGEGQIWVESLNPDFMNIKNPSELVELFGRRWHGESATWTRREPGRLATYAEYGFRCAIIHDNELAPEIVQEKLGTLREAVR